MMVDVNKELKNLYEDAYYYNLIHNGYTIRQAVFYAKGILA
jgi:hypothetical protein